MVRISALVAVVATVLAVAVGAATAGRSSATLSVSFGATASAVPASVPYGTPYVVSGCGYAKGVGVTVVVHSPEAIQFAGQLADSNGCISVSNFSTQGAGHYDLDAWQQVRNKSTKVASTYFDLS